MIHSGPGCDHVQNEYQYHNGDADSGDSTPADVGDSHSATAVKSHTQGSTTFPVTFLYLRKKTDSFHHFCEISCNFANDTDGYLLFVYVYVFFLWLDGAG